MKICIPVSENKGMESSPYNHFGSAPKFLVVNLDGEVIEVIDNGDLNHEHGKCQPLKALANKSVDVVIVRGIGAGAISKLNSLGTKVFKGVEGYVKENLELLKENKLVEFSANNGCDHHNCGHH